MAEAGSDQGEYGRDLALGPRQALDALTDPWFRRGRRAVARTAGLLLAPGSRAGLPAWPESFRQGRQRRHDQFEGDAAQAVFDIHQTGGRRKLCLRWTFDGPDSYHSTLLEDSGAGFTPLAEWDYVRFETLTPSRPPSPEEAPRPSEHLQALESLLGNTWAAEGAWADGDALQIETDFEWIPYANAIHARVFAPTKEGEPLHRLDAYIYHHTGANALRCLALSNRGGVYEGDLSVLEGGALQLDLKGYEDDLVVQHVVRLDFEKDDASRNRIWSLAGPERTLMLDVEHQKLEPKPD